MALLDNIYDTAKGIQWPGLIGGLLGGLFIFNKLGGMEGGMLGMIGTAMAVLAGAWLANKGTEMIGGFVKNHFGKGGPSPTGPGQAIQKPTLAPNSANYKPKDLGGLNPVKIDAALHAEMPQHFDNDTSVTPGTTPTVPKQPTGRPSPAQPSK